MVSFMNKSKSDWTAGTFKTHKATNEKVKLIEKANGPSPLIYWVVESLKTKKRILVSELQLS